MKSTLVLVAALSGVCETACAQTEAPATATDAGGASKETEEEAALLSLDVSLRYESDYFFRGLAQRTDCFNAQPAATLTFHAIESEGFSMSILGGVWNNFSDDTADGSTGAFREYWYESDLYGGVSLTLERLSLSALYTWYTSPASDFDEYEDITFTIGFDDAGLWDSGAAFALKPWISFAVETNGAADGLNSGAWLGVGLTPTFVVGATPLGDLTISTPLATGLSLHDYYEAADGESDTFGYAEAGVVASFDLSKGGGGGLPTVDLGVKYLFLDGVTQSLNSGDSGEVVSSVGLRWSF